MFREAWLLDWIRRALSARSEVAHLQRCRTGIRSRPNRGSYAGCFVNILTWKPAPAPLWGHIGRTRRRSSGRSSSVTDLIVNGISMASARHADLVSVIQRNQRARISLAGSLARKECQQRYHPLNSKLMCSVRSFYFLPHRDTVCATAVDTPSHMPRALRTERAMSALPGSAMRLPRSRRILSFYRYFGGSIRSEALGRWLSPLLPPRIRRGAVDVGSPGAIEIVWQLGFSHVLRAAHLRLALKPPR